MNNLEIDANNVERTELANANAVQATNEAASQNVGAGDAGEDGGEKCNLAEISLLHKMIRKGLVENNNRIEVQRQDPNSPLYSVKTFEALHL